MAKLESTAATSVVEASSNLAVVIEKRQEKLILPEFCLIAPGWRETIFPTCHTQGEAAEKEHSLPSTGRMRHKASTLLRSSCHTSASVQNDPTRTLATPLDFARPRFEDLIGPKE